MLKRAKNKPQKGIRLMQIIFAYFPCLGDDGRGAHNTNFYRGPQRLSPGLIETITKNLDDDDDDDDGDGDDEDNDDEDGDDDYGDFSSAHDSVDEETSTWDGPPVAATLGAIAAPLALITSVRRFTS